MDTDSKNSQHLLQRLWSCTVGLYYRSQGHPEPPFAPISPYWKLIGFQRETPLTDFRGGGILSLEHLVAFVEMHPHFVLALMNDKNELKCVYKIGLIL